MYTLDTNILIYFLKGDLAIARMLKTKLRAGARFFVSTLTEIELFAYPYLNAEESATIDRILYTLTLVPVSSQVARVAAYFRRAYKTPLPDSVIAATAFLTRTAVLSRNVRDFRKIKEISVRKA